MLHGENSMLKINMRALALATALLATSGAASAATTITFEDQTTGAKPNGYTVGGVTFNDAFGNDLQIVTAAESNGTKGLAIFGDDQSYLGMLFSNVSTDLSLAFGNDEVCVTGNCPYNADRAILRLFLNGAEVASTFVLFNQNNIADQRIGINGVSFNVATLTYGNSNLQAGNLIEVVDDITFSAISAVPEPSTWAMMLVGFGAIGASMRRRRRVAAIPQMA